MADGTLAEVLGEVRGRMDMVPPPARAHPVWAAARSAADVPCLLAALDRVLALHQPEEGQHPDFCGADLHEVPCPTVRGISAELLRGEKAHRD